MDERVAFLKRAIEAFRGDDLWRARAAFKDLSASEMAKQHGQSGKTRQQILEGYEGADALWERSRDLFLKHFPEANQ